MTQPPDTPDVHYQNVIPFPRKLRFCILTEAGEQVSVSIDAELDDIMMILDDMGADIHVLSFEYIEDNEIQIANDNDVFLENQDLTPITNNSDLRTKIIILEILVILSVTFHLVFPFLN